MRAKGWSRISPSFDLSLLRIEVIDDADNQRAIQGYLEDRFVPFEDEIIMDVKTGLKWAQDAGGQVITWDNANAYVQKLMLGGYSDWRLPTKEELESLLTYCKSKGIPVEEGKCVEYYSKIGFKNVQHGYYWSSTSYAGSKYHAWVVGMWGGSVHGYNKSVGHYVWPVRSGQ